MLGMLGMLGRQAGLFTAEVEHEQTALRPEERRGVDLAPGSVVHKNAVHKLRTVVEAVTERRVWSASGRIDS